MNDRPSPNEHLHHSSFTDSHWKERNRKKFIVGFFCVIALFALMSLTLRPGEAKSPSDSGVNFLAPSKMFFVGEQLEYEVSYSFFSLGKVKVQILDTVTKNGVTVFQAKAFMDSYSGVPFVDLHYVFYSEIDPQMYSHFFSGLDTKDSNSISYSDYFFDYSHNQVFVQKGIRQQQAPLMEATDTISSIYQDGLSLFYYARENVHSKKTVNVPTFVNEKKVNTYINFMNKKTSSEIDAVKYPVETVEFDGRADFVGIFGLTGGFKGWFSNDEAAVPIVAKMKVILGSVRLELVKWNRPGWVPPQAVDE